MSHFKKITESGLCTVELTEDFINITTVSRPLSIRVSDFKLALTDGQTSSDLANKIMDFLQKYMHDIHGVNKILSEIKDELD